MVLVVKADRTWNWIASSSSTSQEKGVTVVEVCLVGVLPLPRQLSRQGEMYVSPCVLVVQGGDDLEYELGVRLVDSKQIFNYC